MNYEMGQLDSLSHSVPLRGDPFNMGMPLLVYFATRNDRRRTNSCVGVFVTGVRLPYRL